MKLIRLILLSQATIVPDARTCGVDCAFRTFLSLEARFYTEPASLIWPFSQHLIIAARMSLLEQEEGGDRTSGIREVHLDFLPRKNDWRLWPTLQSPFSLSIYTRDYWVSQWLYLPIRKPDIWLPIVSGLMAGSEAVWVNFQKGYRSTGLAQNCLDQQSCYVETP